MLDPLPRTGVLVDDWDGQYWDHVGFETLQNAEGNETTDVVIETGPGLVAGDAARVS